MKYPIQVTITVDTPEEHEALLGVLTQYEGENESAPAEADKPKATRGRKPGKTAREAGKEQLAADAKTTAGAAVPVDAVSPEALITKLQEVSAVASYDDAAAIIKKQKVDHVDQLTQEQRNQVHKECVDFIATHGGAAAPEAKKNLF